MRERLDTSCVTEQTARLDRILREHVVGQAPAIEVLTCAFSRVLGGLHDPRRPLLTVLLLGPTGVGKTETARALAETLFGRSDALIRVNCEEYAHGHELSKLLGSPPGYVGSQIEPRLSQRRLHEPHLRALAERTGLAGEGGLRQLYPAERGHGLSVVLFDEIEKAHPVLWNALLGILEEGQLTLGDNSTSEFTRSIIVMTSNVGTRELSELVGRRTIGFLGGGGEEHPVPPDELRQVALAAVRQTFPLEWLNRFDDVLVYSPLERNHLDAILSRFLREIHTRILGQAGVPVLIKLSPEARGLILERGADLTLGARPLRRAVETEIVDPLSRMIAGHRIAPGDVIEVDRDGDHLVFYRRPAVDRSLVV